jgi:hypothetical protein
MGEVIVFVEHVLQRSNGHLATFQVSISGEFIWLMQRVNSFNGSSDR